jgi:2-amino-4-hydroxy-6-hydroxymethyldihydropteridine diphosphokinase
MQTEAKKYINVYLGLGSNSGNRKGNIEAAKVHIEKLIGKIAKKSSLYETQPWGKTDQESFYNCVVMVNTTLDPRELLTAISKVERELGRERDEKWGPRTIDVDILLYGKRIVRDKGLEVPHPEIAKRAFVLVPLMEIDGDMIHPVLKKSIDELYAECKDLSEVVQLD